MLLNLEKMDLEIRKATIERLEEDVLETSENKIERMENFRKWLDDLYPNSEKIKAVIIGCAIFRRNQQNGKLFSKSKIEKAEWKYKIELSQIYLDLANQFHNCI